MADHLRLIIDRSGGDRAPNVSGRHSATRDFLDAFQRAPTRTIDAALDTADSRARAANQLAEGVKGQVVLFPIITKGHGHNLTQGVSSTQVFFTCQRVDRLHDTKENGRMVSGREKPYPNFVRAWRVFQNLSQERLAELADTTGATISRIENGEENFTFEMFTNIARALQCTPGDLLTRDPNTPADETYRYLKAMPDDDQRRMARFVKSFAEGDLA